MASESQENLPPTASFRGGDVNSSLELEHSTIKGALNEISDSETSWQAIEKQLKLWIERSERYEKETNRLGASAQALSVRETPSLKTGLQEFASCVNKLEVNRKHLNVRLALVLQKHLDGYKSLFQNMMGDVRILQKKSHRKLTKETVFSKLNGRIQKDKVRISQAQVELKGASAEVAQANESVLSAFREFETKKISTMKTILAEFLHANIQYHCKALSELSHAFTSVSSVSEDPDIQDILGIYKLSLKNLDLTTVTGGGDAAGPSE